MNLLPLDFESHYDKDYSLTKMPTMQYLRDERFQCLGVAMPSYMGGPDFFDKSDRLQYYGGEDLHWVLGFDWSITAGLAHNASFDGTLLYEHYGHAPKFWFDTQQMARYAIGQGHLPPDAGTSIKYFGERYGIAKGDTAQAVEAGGQELADYATRDVEIMLKTFEEAKGWNIPTLELELMDLHVRMAAEPILQLDTELLEKLASSEPTAQAKLARKKENFVAALRACGVEPGTKISPRTGKETYAFAKTDSFMKSLGAHQDPRVRELHRLRTEGGSNIVRTRAQRMLAVGNPFPVPLMYYGAHTGRASGADKLNLQNLPARGEGLALRQALMAPPGHKLVVIDLAQIEVRVLAWLAGEEWLLQAFRDGQDVYKVFASRYLYHCGYDEVTSEQRKVAKAAVLALGFGQGANGFLNYCQTFGVPMDPQFAQHVVDTYRAAHPRVVALWEQCYNEVVQTGAQVLPSSRKLTYPDLHYVGRDLHFKRHLVFSKQRKGQRDVIKLWPGLCCLALDTLVLTEDGWVQLQHVGIRRVWDGLEWVSHGGLTKPQTKTTIHLEGVELTPDHEVLTNEGWKLAAESEGFTRAGLWVAQAIAICRERWPKVFMGMRVPLRAPPRSAEYHAVSRRQEKLQPVRLPLPRLRWPGCYARDEQASGVRRLASHARPVPFTDAPGLAQLWGAWDYSVQTLAELLRKFLGGHGGELPSWFNLGPPKQQPRLLKAQLPMGHTAPAGSQQEEQQDCGYTTGADDSVRGVRKVGHKCYDALLQARRWVAGEAPVRRPRFSESLVADLADCGPRNRFVVCAPGGTPFYAHNCENKVQAAARDVVMQQTVWLSKQHRVVLSVHDEAVLCVPEEVAQQAADDAERLFATAPAWAEGLPVKGEYHIVDRYGEAK